MKYQSYQVFQESLQTISVLVSGCENNCRPEKLRMKDYFWIPAKVIEKNM